MKLYESAWYTSYDITKKSPGELKILVRESIPFPFLNKDNYGLVLCLPSFKKLGGTVVEYQGMIFDINNEAHGQIIWNLFRASVYYLSLYVVASDARAYSERVKRKDKDIALNAINIIEDAMINAHAKTFHRPLLPEIALANAVSYLLLKPAELIRNEGVRFATSILSCYKTGMIKGRISQEMLTDTKNIVGTLRDLEEEAIGAYLNRENQSEGDDKESLTVNDDEKGRIFSEIYDRLSKYSNSISEVPSFPYMNHLSRSSIFYNNMKVPAEDEIEKVFQEIMRRLNLRFEFNLNALRNEATQALWDWDTSEKKKEKILDKYKLMGKETHFKAFIFPEEDYAEYLRRKERHSKTIGRITNRLAVYYNIAGDDFRKESGFIDLQEAIQVVASQSRRTDVFMEDTLRYRGQAWAILVDVSLSLRDFAGEVKDVILCLTEVARKLFHDNRSLGVFAFDDKFYIVKDFAENHNRSVCARIGGAEHSGMTYLSDGIKMATQALRRQYEETKIMMVVSDGFPTGYRHITEETKEQIQTAIRSGIHAIGIGIDSRGIKDYFPVYCVVRNPYELMKKFVDTFFQYSSLM